MNDQHGSADPLSPPPDGYRAPTPPPLGLTPPPSDVPQQWSPQPGMPPPVQPGMQPGMPPQPGMQAPPGMPMQPGMPMPTPPPGMPPQVAGWSPPPPAPKSSMSMPLILGIVLGVLVLIAGGLVVVVVTNGDDTAPITDSDEKSGESASPEEYLVQGTGPVDVEVYLDFRCDHCARFHENNHDRLVTEAAAGTITVHYRPVAILDSQSMGDYSVRSANAAACAGEQGSYVDYAAILLTMTPPLGSPGPDDAELIAVGEQLGLGDGFATCVSNGGYVNWVVDTSQQALDSGLAGVPHVTIDGEVVNAPIDMFGMELDAALR